MRKYFALTLARLSMLPNAREHFILSFLGNIVSIILIYFLWKSIYSNHAVLNQLTFTQAFVYLAMGSSLFWVNQTWLEWDVSRSIINGNIVTRLIKPLDLQLQIMFETLGLVLSNFFTIMLPTFLLLQLLNLDMHFGLNIPFFLISMVFSFLISFNFDYIAGLIAFYTESIWGISITKETIILFFSGAIIPINFFPDAIHNVLLYLPFQAIYNIPLTIFISENPMPYFYINSILLQVFWTVVLFGITRLIESYSIKKLTINGG